MPKLSKRQIIILLVIAAVLAYGVYDWHARSAKKGASIPSDAKTISQQALMEASAIPVNPASKMNDYIVRRAEMKWPGDPFYAGNIPLANLTGDTMKSGAGAETEKKADIHYTGYMMAGNKKMAIINGVEYETGEPLEGQGYVLKGIFPSKVIIEDRRDGRVFEVFLQDFLPD